MSYTLIISEIKRGQFEERNLDLFGIAHIMGKPLYVLCPEGSYPLNEKWADVILTTNLKEEEYLMPINICGLLKNVFSRFQMPDEIILPHSSSGTECAAYIAGYFNFPVITDVNGINKEKIAFFKSYYSDKVYGELQSKKAGTVVLTVRSGSFKGNIIEKANAAKKESVTMEPQENERVFIEYIEEEKTDIDITKAEVLLSIGRGVGNKDEIPSYEALASLMNASLSCSRPVVDKMWLPKARQVGQSGKTVRPKVYIAMGISGAFQHITGMKDSECIIAINKDPNAPIFQYAHYGIIADMHKVRDKLKELLKG